MSKLKVISRYVGLFGASLAVAVMLAKWANTPDDDHSAMIQWGSAPSWSDVWVEEASRFDFVFLTPGAWELQDGVQEDLIAMNPDIHLGTYFNLTNVAYWMMDAEDWRYPRKLWDAMTREDRLAWTTEGDTASVWKNQPCFDWTRGDVRAVAIELLRDYMEKEMLTCVFLDYASAPMGIWQAGYDDYVHGELDLNLNGIPHREDQEEIKMTKEAHYAWVRELREALPQGTVLVVNGSLAITDPGFGALFKQDGGIFCEAFPQFFWGSANPMWENALDPEYPNNLHDLLGRAQWVFLDDPYNDPRVSKVADEYGAVHSIRWENR